MVPTRTLALIGLAVAVTGCATIDTGYVDYRRADDPLNVPSTLAAYTCGRSATDPALEGRVCDPVLPAYLIRKNVSGKVGIRPDDVYSIRLDYGYMRYVSELPFRPDRILDGKNPLRAQAEIVVLARAFEFGPMARADVESIGTPASDEEATPAPAPGPGPSENAFVDLEFESLNEARVIYYSPDVENGQSLNFSNIPILGPVKYGGRPVGIQIIVLELDRVSPEMKGLLSSLASMGQTAGAIPTGGATNILIGLGKSLLESNQDDVVFEYRFVLDPSDRVNSYNSAPFEEGRYVLRRLQTRSDAHDWRNVRLDHNTGQLYVYQTEKNAQGQDQEHSRPYTGETYFTVNIVNHGASAKEAGYVYRSLEELRGMIEASASATNSEVISALNGQIVTATENLRGNTMTRELATQWERVAADAMLLAYNSPPATLPAGAQCQLAPRGAASRQRAELALAGSVADFVTGWNDAVTQDADGTARFGDAQRRRVADAVGVFFFGLDDAPAGSTPPVDTFVDVAKFDTLVKETGTTSFLNRVKAYAGAMAPDTCAELISSGLAEGLPSQAS
jgi:hypothetical protein